MMRQTPPSPQSPEQQWENAFWDINKKLGRATADKNNIDQKALEEEIAKAETLAGEILTTFGKDVNGSIKNDAATSYDCARSHNIPTPKLRELLDGFITDPEKSI